MVDVSNFYQQKWWVFETFPQMKVMEKSRAFVFKLEKIQERLLHVFCWNDVGVSKNRGKNSKMDGKNNGSKPY